MQPVKAGEVGRGRSSAVTLLLGTVAASGVIALLAIPTARWFAVALGVEHFGRLQMIRRVANYAHPLLTIGLDTSLVRNLSIARARSESLAPWGFGGAVMAAGSLLIIGLLAWFGAGSVSRLLFGDDDVMLGRAALSFIAATLVHIYAYSLLRGGGRIHAANLVLVVNVGLVPFMVALLRPGPDVLITVAWLAGVVAMLSLAAALLATLLLRIGEPAVVDVRLGVKTLVAYGWRRMAVPGLYGCILLAPPAVLAGRGASVEAGHLLVALTISRLFEQLVGPVGVVMLPRLAEYVGARQLDVVREYTARILTVAASYGLFISLQGSLHAETIVTVWFGSDYAPSAAALRILLLGVAPATVFMLLQTVADAWSSRGLVLWAASGGALVMGVLSVFLGNQAAQIAWASLFGVAGAATLLVLLVVTQVGARPRRRSMVTALATNVTLAGLTVLIHRSGAAQGFVAAIAMVGSQFLLLVLVGLITRSDWTRRTVVTDESLRDEPVPEGERTVVYGLPVPHFFSQLNGTGGHVAHSYGVVDGLARLGLRVTAVGEPDAGLRRRVAELIPLSGGARWGLRRERWSLRFRTAIMGAIARRRPRFVYLRYSVGHGHWLPFSMPRRRPCPLVLEVNSLGGSDAWFVRPLEALALRQADIILVVSHALRRSIAELYGERLATRVLVLPNGVDVSRFPERPAMSRDRSGISIGYVGTMKPGYGLEELIAAMDHRELSGARLTIVGNGPLRPLCKHLARERANVAIEAPVPFEAVPELLLTFDVLVYTTSEALTFQSPLKLFEYMAAGRAIVAARTEVTVDALRNGEVGLLFATGDQATLAAHLVTLARDPELRLAMGADARREAFATHSWDRRMQKLLTVIEEQCAAE